MVVEIAGRVAYFSKKRAVIMARGVRLALRDGVPQRFAGDDEHWQTADLRVAVTEDQRVSFEVPGGVAYFSKNDARDVSTGLRLAIGQLGPEDRWCS
ncbi:hypothetical protein [Amycolatopsis thermoflava]|uniref:hypothetical protein n=1 Tax=Amycolatopsis thermoflava TaxID=84480 RepID=UPI003F4A7475